MEQVEEWLLPLGVGVDGVHGDAELAIVSLPLRQQPQEMLNWCWAAIAASLSSYYGTGWALQCNLATFLLNQRCCLQPPPAACNQTQSLVIATETVGVLREMVPAAATFAQVMQEINARQPLAANIVWQAGGAAHAVNIYGYQTPGQILIGDPRFGDHLVAYAWFPAHYQGGGEWNQSLYTEP